MFKVILPYIIMVILSILIVGVFAKYYEREDMNEYYRAGVIHGREEAIRQQCFN